MGGTNLGSGLASNVGLGDLTHLELQMEHIEGSISHCALSTFRRYSRSTISYVSQLFCPARLL